MIDEATLAQINGQYVCPPDAGPAWREAFEAGVDMSLIEINLQRTPWERLLANENALKVVQMAQAIKAPIDQ